ncbi:MAG: enoyl-CoA hydratase [Rhodocyclaceae bacterium]|nr:MAG: enoyl-CoA hydratase [Rhodocyclaceae bacterium]
MPDTTPLIVARDGAVVTLQFNRPESLNALDVPTAQAFLAAMRAIATDGSVRAVVLKGCGRAFIAGGDLAAMSAAPRQTVAELLGAINEAVLLMQRIDAPIIAQVHGVAAGGGLSLMLMCDFVLVAEKTRFNLAYIKLGANCDVGASWSLPRLVGLRKALEIALLSEDFDADEALRLGLINRVVPAPELEATVNALAQRLASGPTTAYGHMRRLMRASQDTDLANALQAEARGFDACTQTADLPEGIAAFLAKRAPRFTGH